MKNRFRISLCCLALALSGCEIIYRLGMHQDGGTASADASMDGGGATSTTTDGGACIEKTDPAVTVYYPKEQCWTSLIGCPANETTFEDLCGCGCLDEEISCINEALQTQFPTCTASTNQVDCESNGGSWEKVGRSQTLACVCPTGEENCVCDESSDCISGLCMTPPDSDNLACSSQTGHCAARNAVFGCFCDYRRPGEILGQCVD